MKYIRANSKQLFLIILIFLTFLCSSVQAKSVPVSSASAGIWLDFDLETKQAIDSVSIAWSRGNQKSVDFNIQMSVDDTNWTTVYTGVSSSANLEQYTLSSTQARYMRIQINGLTQDYKALISDLRLNEHLNITAAVEESTVTPVAQNQNLLPIRNTENMIEIGFEQPDLLGNGLIASGNAPKVVSKNVPVFEGKQSLSVFLDKNKSTVPSNTEFTLGTKQYGKQFTEFEYGKDYWIGFAIYLDDDYQMPEFGDHVFSLNSRPDKRLGEGNRQANIVFTVSGKKENKKRGVNEPHWTIAIRGDDRRVLPKNGAKFRTSESTTLSPVAGDTGRWVSWVIHFKHTYNADGFMDIWKDGVQVYSKNGIHTSFNDKRGPFVRMGSNKWSWKSDKYTAIKPAKRQSYLDALRIAQGADRYNDVAPVSASEILDANKQPVVVKEPVVVKQPIVIKQPVVVKEPVVVKQPVVVKEPVVIKQPVVVKNPNQSSFRNTKNMMELGFEEPNLKSTGLIISGTEAKMIRSNQGPVFEGKQSLSVFIDRKTSRTEYRSEFAIATSKHEKQFTHLENGQEYWVGFAVYLDKNYRSPIYADTFFQIHGRPDLKLGESYRNPAIALRIVGKKDHGKYGINQAHWAISINGDSKKITNGAYSSRHLAPLSPIAGDKGRWVRWVVHFKNSYKKDGFIEIWKDGVKVHKKTGIATAFNDERGGYVKMGSYKWSWRKKHSFETILPARRQSYLDAVRIGKGSNRYNDVAP
jgi:hypothetical protein